ncbi:hypothetical protein R7D64_05855 [Vibrio sp. Vb2535]|uniref:hypothetical protein n=1 Tax=Vibrio sp. Vb2535 TaxID=3074667 RepID=UPI0029646DDF|nr:hypothetical protein [Vibrio sp. Vb2535]MDW1752421.1 hypothetical protein [Vibrio sp. Vb2535]
MKLPIACSQCMQENVSLNMLVTVEFQDNGRYEIRCPKGHSSITVLQQQKFEILFEIGAHAIIDGYYREAVSSFTSALERFYEFFIKVICSSKQIEWPNIENAWKDVSSQSERQLGAFIFLHLLETGCKPVLLNNNKIKFRNDVIHKGKIPNKEQAIEYGQAILNVIRPLLLMLNQKYSETVSTATTQHLDQARNPSVQDSPASTMWIPTILGLANDKPSDNIINLSEEIEELRCRVDDLRSLSE